MQSAKDTAANVAASAKSGMEKTKATVQEKGEKMSTRDPLKKEMATEKKDERKEDAELQKQQTHQQHHTTGATGGVGAQDPNVAGGYHTGYGSGNTV